ncbi:hypothetical protein ALC53_03053 [Atta colombica]|uniref:Uncharacterized protein n=1 Tax=Atta colombica TaxID=520822 RepID=A0A195BPZ0_9HYME|nr:hypothetical protein ALC53_03053 [Atta colombica]
MLAVGLVRASRFESGLACLKVSSQQVTHQPTTRLSSEPLDGPSLLALNRSGHYLLRMLLTHKESCVQLVVKSGFTGIVPTMVPLGSPSLISSWTRVSTALLCIARPIAAVLSCGNIGDLRGTNRCIREETSPGRGGSDPPRAAPRETRRNVSTVKKNVAFPRADLTRLNRAGPRTSPLPGEAFFGLADAVPLRFIGPSLSPSLPVHYPSSIPYISVLPLSLSFYLCFCPDHPGMAYRYHLLCPL